MDARERRLQAALRYVAGRDVPDEVDLWSSVRGQLRHGRMKTVTATARPVVNLRWAFAALVAALLIAGTAYAVSSGLDRLFSTWVSLRHMSDTALGTELGLSKTVGDVTVTLEKAYADANQITIGYTYSLGPHPARELSAETATLTASDGTIFATASGAGARFGDGSSGLALRFDSAALKGTPERLTLHLELMLAGSAPASSSGGREAGPFAFDFTVPFVAAQTVDPGQVVSQNGVAISLERVTYTPSLTGITYCLATAPDAAYDWQPQVTLATPEGSASWGGTFSLGDYGYDYAKLPPQILFGQSDRDLLPRLAGRGCFRSVFFLPGKAASGQWQFTVDRLEGTNRQAPERHKVIEGPWIFSVTALLK